VLGYNTKLSGNSSVKQISSAMANQHIAFATTMDPDTQSDQDPCCSLSLSLFVIGFVNCKRTSWILMTA
jgi:hypothetical protein